MPSSVLEKESGPTSALAFFRDFVSPNRPVLFKNAAREWPALKKWTDEYLREKLGDERVTISETPTGYADALARDPGSGRTVFVMPHEARMTMAEFLDKLARKESGNVGYVQKQNSNLTEEFSSLLDDVFEFPWAAEAFGKSPDAINFWMGDERAVTSSKQQV